MNTQEIRLLKIHSLPDRFDAICDYLNVNEPSIIFVKKLLYDEYDAVRSEGLDYILRIKEFSYFKDDLMYLIKNENSDFVLGRIYLISSIFKEKEIISSIEANQKFAQNPYYFCWFSAGEFLRHKEISFALVLIALSKNTNFTISSIAIDLLENLFCEDDLRVLLDNVNGAHAQCVDILSKIND